MCVCACGWVSDALELASVGHWCLSWMLGTRIQVLMLSQQALLATEPCLQVPRKVSTLNEFVSKFSVLPLGNVLLLGTVRLLEPWKPNCHWDLHFLCCSDRCMVFVLCLHTCQYPLCSGWTEWITDWGCSWGPWSCHCHVQQLPLHFLGILHIL